MTDRPLSPPTLPKTGPVTTPFAEARVIFAGFDRNANTWLEGGKGEYVAIEDRGDGTSAVTDYGDVFRRVGKLNGDPSAISMLHFERFVASFDKDRDGSLNAVEWASYSAFLARHQTVTFGASR